MASRGLIRHFYTPKARNRHSSCVLLSFLAYELADGFDGSTAVVSGAETEPLGFAMDEPGVEAGL